MKIARVLSLGCGLFAVGFGLLAQQAPAESTYQVKPGDSLWRIAKHTQGKGSAWRDLFALNKDKIRDPDIIRVGQHLALPNSPPAAQAAVTPEAASSVCTPLGNPLPASQWSGSNAFYLCKQGAPAANGHWGTSTELYIVCNQNTRKAGLKWHIWCNPNGSHCGCNKNDFETTISTNGSCCQWSAGDHCTIDGSARPGQNGCASW